MAPQKEDKLITLKGAKLITLWRPKGGQANNSPAYIYIYIYKYIGHIGECLEMRPTFPVCISKEALLREKKGCIQMWDPRENGDTDRHRQNEERRQTNGQREKPQWRDRDGEILDSKGQKNYLYGSNKKGQTDHNSRSSLPTLFGV